jgi:uncharacterized membrane protein
MLLAAIDSFGYKLLFLLHIVAIVVAFAPGFVLPGLRRKVDEKVLAAAAAANEMRIHGPALVLAGLFGFGLIGMSDKAFKFSQPWISVAMLLWLIMLGVVFAVLLPAEKRTAAGDQGSAKIMNMAGGILHLLFLVMVIDMIWKPGL